MFSLLPETVAFSLANPASPKMFTLRPQIAALSQAIPRHRLRLVARRSAQRPSSVVSVLTSESPHMSPAVALPSLSFPVLVCVSNHCALGLGFKDHEATLTLQFDDAFKGFGQLRLIGFLYHDSGQVNGCTGKMGRAVAEAAISAGLQLVPVSFSSLEKPGRTLKVGNTEIQIHGPSERESVLSSVFHEFPDVIVVDYTVPDAVNGIHYILHFLVVAFLAAMDIMADQFPGAFSGYTLEVMESHQASKLDTSGTAKAVISCFQKLGVTFDMKQIKQIRDPKKQLEMVGVPEEHLCGHAFHMYHLTSPDET
ncbi:hypothetical protein GW17_00008862 [Ensete ventricosum]|nr:hypothetical protein GW17_00008862 [Ensete ventricosum]RZS07325.1 hypothetical protein BHM03_00038152 [Ensete ventricosum]